MKVIWVMLILILISACSREQPSTTRVDASITNASATANERQLVATKAQYPFKKLSWRSASRFAAIFDTLIAELVSSGENAREAQKLAVFRRAVTALNDLHRKDTSLIETSEAEQLCELLADIAIAAGMPPSKFPDEEGAASGRDW